MPKSAKPQKALALGGIGGGGSRPFSGIVEDSKSSSQEEKKHLPYHSGLDLDSVREIPPEVVL